MFRGPFEQMVVGYFLHNFLHQLLSRWIHNHLKCFRHDVLSVAFVWTIISTGTTIGEIGTGFA
jgi:hypothetical protein